METVARAFRAGTSLAAVLGVVVSVGFVGVVNGAGRGLGPGEEDVGGFRPNRVDLLDPVLAAGPYGRPADPLGVAASRSAVREPLTLAAAPGAEGDVAPEPAAEVPVAAGEDVAASEVAAEPAPFDLFGALEDYERLDSFPIVDEAGEGLELLPPAEADLAELVAAVAAVDEEPEPEPAAPAVRLPVEGFVLTAGFGASGRLWRHRHTGLDMAAPMGTPVRAVADGVVVAAGWAGRYGNRIVLAHPDGTQTWYCHLSRIFPKRTLGRHFDVGDGLGRVGSSGNSTGPHLHLEVRENGRPVDPRAWLRAHGADI